LLRVMGKTSQVRATLRSKVPLG